MAIQHATATLGGVAGIGVAGTFISVSRPENLAPALRQHEKEIVIEDAEIRKKVERIIRWEARVQSWTLGFIALLVVAVLTYAMSKDYGIDATWRLKRKSIE